MSRSIDLPDTVYAALEAAAATTGTTPAGWIAARVTPSPAAEPECEGQPLGTLADEFAGRVGVVSSGRSNLSERVSELYGEAVMEKHRARQPRAHQEAALGSSIDLPDPVRVALEEAASASGNTPAGWIAAHLPSATLPQCDEPSSKTPAERFAALVGGFRSEHGDLAERHSELFMEGLLEKRRLGHL